MTALPGEFVDRWRDRGGTPDFRDSVCWHLLLGDSPDVNAIASQARRRLAGFTGLHMTPARWLHATVLLAASASELTQSDMEQMLTRARVTLSAMHPVSVTVGRVLYHPEGIALAMSPRAALAPVFEAAQAATFEVTGRNGVTSSTGPFWVPHVTLCYSTSQQPAGPIIAALGAALPSREVTIDRLDLVVQHGPELEWDWCPVGSAWLENRRD
jgi:2'-5' RNA ligase